MAEFKNINNPPITNSKNDDTITTSEKKGGDSIISKIDKDDGEKLDAIIEELRKTHIKPLSNQQRNLDREEGGIENEDKSAEDHIIDEWDNRIEEVQKMGENINPSSSTAKESMLWNLLKLKWMNKKLTEKAIQNLQDIKKQNGSSFDSSKEQSFSQKINALRQDRTGLNDPSKIR